MEGVRDIVNGQSEMTPSITTDLCVRFGGGGIAIWEVSGGRLHHNHQINWITQRKHRSLISLNVMPIHNHQIDLIAGSAALFLTQSSMDSTKLDLKINRLIG